MIRRTKYLPSPDEAVTYYHIAQVLELFRRFGFSQGVEQEEVPNMGPIVADLFEGMAPDIRLEKVVQGKLRLIQDHNGWYIEGELPVTFDDPY